MPGFVPVGGGPVGADARVIVIVTKARVSQVIVEAVGTPAANARVSQVLIEAVVTPLTSARVSQIIIEAVGSVVTADGAVAAPTMGRLAASGRLVASQIATFTCTLSAPSAAAIEVTYATVPATATSPTDFVATSGTLTFAAGVTTQTIVVEILADTAANADKSFSVVLSGPVNCLLASPPSGTCIISTLTIG